MDNSGYVALTRQSGLLRAMQAVANNIANLSTTGFRKEGLIFSEHVERIEGAASLSMATANVRRTSMAQGTLAQTGGRFDMAIDRVETGVELAVGKPDVANRIMRRFGKTRPVESARRFKPERRWIANRSRACFGKTQMQCPSPEWHR